MRYALIFGLFLSGIIACNTAKKTAEEPVDEKGKNMQMRDLPPPENHLVNQHFQMELAYMDLTERPQDNFYNFVNGGWTKTAKIPADKDRWGSFNELREYTDSVTLGILKKSFTQNYAPGTDGWKVAKLYETIMDTIGRDKLGIKPIQSHLEEIENIKNLSGLEQYLTKNTPHGGNVFYGFYVSSHMKKSMENTVYLGGPELGMARDYYHKDDESSKEKLNKYQDFIAILFDKIGEKNASSKAQKVVAFEKQLAENLITVENIRDSKLKYNPRATKDLSSLVKNVDIAKNLAFFNAAIDTIIIPEIKYYQNIDQYLTENNIETIKLYLKAQIVNRSAGLLDMDLEQKNFDFYSKVLRGIEQMRARDKRALGTINGTLGEALGQLYVKEVFPPEAKKEAKEMVAYLKKSFDKHIKELSWMSPETKEKALVKLAKFKVKIGYPDKWKDYAKLDIKGLQQGGSYFSNMLSYNEWKFNENLSKLYKPVDKSEWFMAPQTVNAYYSPRFNEIVFPAAILQSPFYNYKADPAINFGGIGAVIGHEISHGFDDSGSQYDGDGNLNNWWTEEDHKAFSKAGEALVAQYDGYEPLPGVNVNGKFTLGENIADLGGVSVAYDALLMYLKDKGDLEKIDGFTQPQRFYISWATIWRTLSRDEAIKNQVKTDPHSPGYFRAIGPLENVEGFYDAFGLKEGDKHYKEKENRILIW